MLNAFNFVPVNKGDNDSFISLWIESKKSKLRKGLVEQS